MNYDRALAQYKLALKKNLYTEQALQEDLEQMDNTFSTIFGAFEATDKVTSKKKDKRKLDKYAKKHNFKWDEDKKAYVGGRQDGDIQISEGQLMNIKKQEETHGYINPDKEFNIYNTLYQPATKEDKEAGIEYGLRREVFSNPDWTPKDPSRPPSIPIQSDDEFFDENIIIKDTKLEEFDDWVPPKSKEETKIKKVAPDTLKKEDLNPATSWQQNVENVEWGDGTQWTNQAVSTWDQWNQDSKSDSASMTYDSQGNLVSQEELDRMRDLSNQNIQQVSLSGFGADAVDFSTPNYTADDIARAQDYIDKGWRADDTVNPDAYRSLGGQYPNKKPLSFKYGGKYITDGPETIIVGDNPGGKELVEVIPLSEASSKGRGGDTLIRELGGESQHVNLFEAYMIDTYGEIAEEAIIKNTLKHNDGYSINPETGLKENNFFGEVLQKTADWMGEGGGNLLLSGIKMVGGAAKKAKAAREQIGELGSAIEGMREQQEDANNLLLEEIDNLSEVSELQFDTLVDSVDVDAIGDTSTQLKSGSGALDTGSRENIIADVKEDTAESVQLSQDKINMELSRAKDQAEEVAEANQMNIQNSIVEAGKQIDKLKGQDRWYKNLF